MAGVSGMCRYYVSWRAVPAGVEDGGRRRNQENLQDQMRIW